MTKAKKGGKKKDADVDSDVDFVDPIKASLASEDDPVSSLPVAPPKQKKAKAKKVGKVERHDSDDDFVDPIKAAAGKQTVDDEPGPKQKKTKAKKKGRQADNESGDDFVDPIKAAGERQNLEDEEYPKQKQNKSKKKGRQNINESDEEEVDVIKAAKEQNGKDDDDDDNYVGNKLVKKSKKAKNRKGKINVDDDDDGHDAELERKMKVLMLEADSSPTEEDIPQPVSSKKNKVKAQSVAATSAFDILEKENIPEKPTQQSTENKKSKQKPELTVTSGYNEDEESTYIRDEDDYDISSRLAALPADSGDENEADGKTQKKEKKKKKKEKVKAKPKQEDDDIDAILADLDKKPPETSKGKKKAEEKVPNQAHPVTSETAVATTLPVELNNEPPAAVTQEVPAPEVVVEEESAASKKKKKKQKQKEKKEEQGAQVEETAEKELPEDNEADEEKEEGGKGKKKKKAKGKKVESTAEDKEKRPKSKAVAALQEALQKAKEEQERMERAEEEKIKKLEEAKRQREEEKRKKELAKKQLKEKQKERLAKKKQEGTYMTPKQKEDRAKLLQMMNAGGITVPLPGEKPVKPMYGKHKKPKATADAVIQQTPTEEQKVLESNDKKEAGEDTKDNWEDEKAEEDDTKEAWDDSSSEEETAIGQPEVDQPATKSSEEINGDKERKAANAEQEDESEEETDGSEDEDESEEDSSEESSEDESDSEEELSPKERALARIMKRQQDAEAKKSTDKLRAPVVCVLGHVDTGKTKILDKLRRTNVQDGEAGGITQQIGATNVPLDAIQKQTSFVKDFESDKLKVPGLLIIDTPGHESFSNLRTRGSSLCDIAILVIDIMHGLEPQTIESIQLLKKGKTPFIVALNKIDRLYGWKSSPYKDVSSVIKSQQPNTKAEFDERSKGVITQLAEQGLNAALYYENTNPKEYVSLIPTSAHSGDGMGNLIALICQFSQTFLAKRVAVSDDLQATVMEVKALPGLGTTVDVILVNGKLKNGDVVVMPGLEGPIVTHIRELLMPEPMRELRVKSQFRHHKEVEAAQGVKIVGKDLDKVMAGLPMYVAKYQDEIEVYKEWINEALKSALNSIKLSNTGVFVQASTLGSLEALLEYLKSVNVPYAGINIGPVHKKDVMRASVMIDHQQPEYATILAFDVKVEREAQEMADNLEVKIFTADIIYHLFDAFTKYQEELLEKGRQENMHLKIFPCKVRILPQYVFNSRDPIICGVCVEAGFLTTGTPICVPSKEFIVLGVVTSIEKENKAIEKATKGMEVCIKIENIPGQAPRLFGRHFDEKDLLVSKISRESIDAVKKYFKKDMSKDDWKLVIELKKTFDIM